MPPEPDTTRPAELARAEPEQRAPATARPVAHGARSEVRVKARARAHRRAFLRRARLRAGDLDAVTIAMLDLWARGKAQLDLRDEAEAGAGKDYWVSFNAVRRALDLLARRLHELGLDRGVAGDALRSHIEATYGGKS